MRGVASWSWLWRRIGVLAFLAAPASLVVATAFAQAGPEGPLPPETGAVVVEDSLAQAGLARAGVCASRKGVTKFVDEGWLLETTGRCTETSTSVGIGQRLDGLTLPDGEMRFELRVATGVDRTRLQLWFRDQGAQRDGYVLTVHPGQGVARIEHYNAETRQYTVVAERSDLVGVVAPTDWIALALRLEGSRAWLLLNETTVLSLEGLLLDSGGVAVYVNRAGDLDDEEPASLVLRNLRVASLAVSEANRDPTYQPPVATQSAAAQPAAQSPSGPPWVGDVSFGYDVSGAGAVPSGSRLPIVVSGTIYGFWSWRNVPPSSRMGYQILFNKEVVWQRDFVPSGPNGRARVQVVRFEGAGGTGQVDWSHIVCELVVTLDGREVVRGWVQPD
jgi:hypothetical protein